ncbi:MAG: ABC transporter permease [Clostridia bacterium]|nr:ABC transporter permease [Clostridia bacterium]
MRKLRKTVIEPNGRNFQYWKDIWNYRELALNFAKRDVTVRYKQTRIGLGWAVIAPIINVFVMTFIFGNLAGLESDGNAPYFVMVYAGTIPWGLFSKAITSVSSTFITNADIMKKVYFPRLISPIGTSIAHVIDSLVALSILLIMMLIMGYFPSVKFLLFPVFFLICLLLGSSLGLFLSSFNVKWRDLSQIIPFAISVGQYLTPVAYSIDSIPENFRLIYSLNPATGAINAFKWCLIKDMPFDWTSFIITIVWIIFLFPIGIYFFRKTERTFVDIV